MEDFNLRSDRAAHELQIVNCPSQVPYAVEPLVLQFILAVLSPLLTLSSFICRISRK